MHQIAHGFRRTEQREQNMPVNHACFRQYTDPSLSIDFYVVFQCCKGEGHSPAFERFISRERQRKQNIRSQ